MDTHSHTLALSVINDEATQEHRVKNYLSMTKRAFSAYALELVNAKAKEEARKLAVRFKPRDIDAALADVIEYHKNAHRDSVGTEEQEADGMRAVIYLASLDGKIVTPQEAKILWAGADEFGRAMWMKLYHKNMAVPA